jgi:glycosyltransferase involved in cell wall biosynthesis
MRVAFFTDTYLPQVNGVVNTVSRLAAHLKQAGHASLVFAPRDGNAPASGNVHSFFSVKFPLYRQMRVAIPSYQSVERALDCFRPDLVHLVTEYTAGLAGLAYARRHRVPLVSSYHTNMPQYLRYYRIPLLEKGLWHYMRWFHGFSRITFCPSRSTYKLLEERGFNNLAVWGRGVDTGLFHPGKKDYDIRRQYGRGKETLLLYVGRLAAEKDLDVLLEALRLINARLGNVQLVMAGDGPLREELSRYAPANVTFTGYLREEELAKVYASCDIFMFPSTSETYGNVVLEAMASGLPVVAVDVGGVNENLVNGFNGLAIAPRSAPEMAEAAMRLMREQGERTMMSLNARIHAEKRSWDSAFATLLEGYRRVLEWEAVSVADRRNPEVNRRTSAVKGRMSAKG